ncbi:MAG: hypothetical protein AB8F74_06815 [Saprospiraceae bacterium]
MKFRIHQLLLLSCLLSMAIFSSCGKENMDETNTEDGEFPIDSIDCMINYDLTLGLLGAPVESISVTNITGGTEPFSYLWSTGDSTDFTLAPTVGTYSVTVTDDNNCTQENSIFVDLNTTPCDTSFSVIINQVDTVMGKTLTAIPQLGTAPYTYEWSTGEVTNEIIVTLGGNYSVTVTDANGCTTDMTTTVTSTDPCFGFTVAIQDTLFNGSIDSLELFPIVNAGSLPYTYSWSTGETTEVIIVLNDTSEVYSITVTDAIGCIAIDTL